MKTGRKYGEKEKIQILIKSLIFRTLRIYIFSFYAFIFSGLFPDAKILKYISQYLIRRDLSRDFTEIMQAFPNVL